MVFLFLSTEIEVLHLPLNTLVLSRTFHPKMDGMVESVVNIVEIDGMDEIVVNILEYIL